VAVSAAEVKTLRERTGAGMMDCKRVLVEAEGDLERATDLLRERGLLKARKRAGRITSEGRIAASVSEDGRRGALVEINCETDFVAKTDDYTALATEVAEVVRDQNPADLDALLSAKLGDASVEDHLSGAIAKLGENIQVRRFARIEAPEGGYVGSYIHAGGKIGALVEVSADDPSRAEVRTLARNLCMHVTAASPSGVSREDLPAKEVERERVALRKQAEQEGKPANIIDRMVEGRLGKFFREVVLVEQPLVMDPDKSVGAAAKEAGAAVTSFVRQQLGEEPVE
jgi:elongation factor Ts